MRIQFIYFFGERIHKSQNSFSYFSKVVVFCLGMLNKTFCWLQDVHDRALFYYRLLQHNINVAERVVNPPKQAVSVFADTQSSEIKDRIFDEFNSLSVVYQKVRIILIPCK